jgi:hypothetical protein
LVQRAGGETFPARDLERPSLLAMNARKPDGVRSLGAST